MKMVREGFARGRWIVSAAITLACSVQAASAVTAEFQVRLAPTELDAVLDLGNPADLQLDLELWVTVGDGPPADGLLGFSFFLQPTAGNVVGIDSASITNHLSPEPFQPQGADNNPVTGAFSRAVGFLPPGPVLLSGETKLASFSVTALNEGTVTYQFLSAAPMRPWSLDFGDFSSAALSAAEPLRIEVIPEPGMGVLMLLGLGLAARRRRGA